MIREVRVVSRRFDLPDGHTLSVARQDGAYRTIETLTERTPQSIIDAVEASGLRGKGGGGAPTGAKWRLMEGSFGGRPKYVVVNGDESEPGTFKDGRILTRDPHLLIEGIILTCYALGAHDAWVYLRGEYAAQQAVLQSALDAAYTAGILGDRVLGHDYRVDITIHRGAGAYICGEKSALLESMEGKRGHPRLKPHVKEPEWYFGNPTLVNNVETIATVPFIVAQGPEAYRAYGTERSPGTLLFALSGHVQRPGVYEAEFGVSMLEYIEHFGGGMRNGTSLKAVIPGGASTPVITAQEAADAHLDYEDLRRIGSALGTGGMIVMDAKTDMVAALKNLVAFYHHESCGQCTPCREGTGWADRILDALLAGQGTPEAVEKLRGISQTMNGKTVCVFAPAVSGVIDAFIKKFPEAFAHVLDAGREHGGRS